ncbi:hypothetical protein LCGC14_1235180 [marine sediment metagenome]|uniref:Uncharacterized protein n=1 Tax=marine sediment metagenome TaxID=412755 RepID=A0A0F9LBM1_9ZZZZ
MRPIWMIYKLKIYRWQWYIINGKCQKITKEQIWDVINSLGLKSVRSVKKNKKPYIMVKLTSKDEYDKLKRRF